jgi:hypothetical protein
MTATLSVCNWDDFQHYRDRNPTWIKLYRDLLTTEAWLLGNDLSRLVHVASILLAARYKNLIPYKLDLIKKAAHLDASEPAVDQAIQHLVVYKFLIINAAPDGELHLEHSASNLLAKCSSEERRGDKRRKDIPPIPPFDPATVPGLDLEAWTTWIAYRDQRKPAIKPISMATAAKRMAKLGSEQRAAVDQSIANGWQGLFQEKTYGGNGGIPRTPQKPPRTVAQMEADEEKENAKQ